MKKTQLSKIHHQILGLLQEHPEGISEGEMRAALGIKAEDQVQFGRRRRELHSHYRIEKKRAGSKTLYVYVGPLDVARDDTPIDAKTRALVLHLAHGRCGMCGRTVEKHGVALVIDHKVPRAWGGKTQPDNLWAICEECNQGKKNLFASVDSEAVRAASQHESVHVRIGELLKAAGVRNPVPSYVIDIVANQDDWQKRLRELRYLKWVIKPLKKRLPSGRVQASYLLERFTEWPPDPTGWIRRYEQERAKRNRLRTT